MKQYIVFFKKDETAGKASGRAEIGARNLALGIKVKGLIEAFASANGLQSELAGIGEPQGGLRILNVKCSESFKGRLETEIADSIDFIVHDFDLRVPRAKKPPAPRA